MKTITWIMIVLLSIGVLFVELIRFATKEGNPLQLSDENRYDLILLIDALKDMSISQRFFVNLLLGGFLISEFVSKIIMLGMDTKNRK